MRLPLTVIEYLLPTRLIKKQNHLTLVVQPLETFDISLSIIDFKNFRKSLKLL